MKSRRILLVEDDPGLGFVIQDTLKAQGYTVHLSRDGKEGLNQFHTQQYDLCLLDVMMPKKDGFELAADIRKINKEVPIIFLTAKSMVEDKVKGFKSGADDYITKPFSNEELTLRIEAILKRYPTDGAEEHEKSQSHTFGSFTFDLDTFELTHPEHTRILTKKEAGILKLLCENKNKVIERELIANLVWGDDSYFVGRSLDVFITRLRKYLALDEGVTIANVHGVGFKLEDK
jgi:DNA-binding response OmpR family regulator